MTTADRAGRYELADVIGVGSFATVHLATDELLDATVVVKVLAENHSLNPEVRERFIAEGRSLRRVESPHVVTVHDIGESAQQQPYLVLSHADRGTLAQRVSALRSLGWTASAADVLAVARPLASALAAVHGAGLVHRDLSPSNVLLTSVNGTDLDGDAREGESALVSTDERLVLADLGLCKDLALNSGLTVAGGTSGFRPPEQRVSGTVDTRADLWALSALLTWLAEGASLPPRLRGVLQRSLAENPAQRHPDAGVWLRDVERALEPAPQPTHTARKPWLWAVVAVVPLVMGVGVGLLIGYLGGPRSSSDTASVAIEGPAQIAVGENATFVAEVTGASSWLWTLPTGEYDVDADSITLTPIGPGRARVVLSAVDESGHEITTVHVLTVTE